MSKYTVVIVPDSPDSALERHPRLTIYVDTGGSAPKVTGMAVSAPGPDGLTSANFPHIDLVAVVEAIASRVLPKKLSSESISFENSLSAPPDPEQTIPNSMHTASLVRPGEITSPGTAEPVETSGSTKPASGRMYRKMPDPHELRENLQRIGTVTGLANHYGVPRHTAQGWASRLRKLNGPDTPVSSPASD